MTNIYEGFIMDGMPIMYDRCTITISKDGTCIKSVLPDDAVAIRRLQDEYCILEKIQGEAFPPRLIAYSQANHQLRMEYIQGLSLYEFSQKYGKIPESFAKQYVNILLRLLDLEINYVDCKSDHFIIDNAGNLRLIDYGVCDLVTNSNAIDYAKSGLKRQYAFAFYATKDDEESKDEYMQQLLCDGIEKTIILKFMDNMEYIL